MPKFLILLAAGGLLGLGLLAVNPRSVASHPVHPKTFPKVQSVKSLAPTRPQPNPTATAPQPAGHGAQAAPKTVQSSAMSALHSQSPVVQHTAKVTESLQGLSNTVKNITNLPGKVGQGLALKP